MSVDPVFIAADSVARWRREEGPTPEEEEAAAATPEVTEVITILDADNPQVARFQARYQEILEERLGELQEQIKGANEDLKSRQLEAVTVGEFVHDAQAQLSKLRNDQDAQSEDMNKLKTGRQELESKLQRTRKKHEQKFSDLLRERHEMEEARLKNEEGNKMLYMLRIEVDIIEDRSGAARRAAERSEKIQDEREREKLQQDLRVSILSDRMDRLREDVGMLDAQVMVQRDTNLSLRSLLVSSMNECDTLQVETRRIQRQWARAVNWLRLRDENLDVLQKALEEQHQLILTLRSQLGAVRKAIAMEQSELERNTATLNRIEHAIKADRSLMERCEREAEALRRDYSEATRILNVTEEDLSNETAERDKHLQSLEQLYNRIQKQYEAKDKVKDNIMELNMAKAIADQNAKYGKNLVLKKRAHVKILERALVDEDNGLANQELYIVHYESKLSRANEENKRLGAKAEKILKAMSETEGYIERQLKSMGDNYKIINHINEELLALIAAAGQKEMGPLELAIQALKADIKDLLNANQDMKKEWMTEQEELEKLTRQRHSNRHKNEIAGKELEVLDTKKAKLLADIKAEYEHIRELQKSISRCQSNQMSLRNQLSERLSQEEQLEHETFVKSYCAEKYIEETEVELISLRIKVDGTIAERDRLLDSRPDVERQVLFYEGKIRAAQEILNLVDIDISTDIGAMRAEIHRMEIRLHHVTMEENKQSQALAHAATIHSYLDRRAERSKTKETSLPPTFLQALSRDIRSLKRKIKERAEGISRIDEQLMEMRLKQDERAYRAEAARQDLEKWVKFIEKAESDVDTLASEKRRGLVDLVREQRKLCWYEKNAKCKYHRAYGDCSSREFEAKKLCCKIGTIARIVGTLMEEFPMTQVGLQRALDSFGSCVGPLPVPPKK